MVPYLHLVGTNQPSPMKNNVNTDGDLPNWEIISSFQERNADRKLLMAVAINLRGKGRELSKSHDTDMMGHSCTDLAEIIEQYLTSTKL